MIAKLLCLWNGHRWKNIGVTDKAVNFWCSRCGVIQVDHFPSHYNPRSDE